MRHPTAVVDPAAVLDPSVELGPYAVIEGAVRVGARTRILAHAVLRGPLEMGADNVVHPGAVLGGEPQDLGWTDHGQGVRIGAGNVFREGVTVHRATRHPFTEIGDRGYFMQNAHVAHDCRIGDDVIVAGGALLSGHVVMESRANVSGNVTVHQFVRIGRLALLRGLSRTSRNVPPFCIMDDTHTVRAINRVGLRRAGIPAAEIGALQAAFRTLFLERRNLALAVEEVAAGSTSPCVAELLDFIRGSDRPVCFGPRG